MVGIQWVELLSAGSANVPQVFFLNIALVTGTKRPKITVVDQYIELPNHPLVL
jgi:hypothetical protein